MGGIEQRWGEFWVRLISRHALIQYMRFRDETCRSLGEKVGCSRSVIGHLRSGARSTCRPDIAKKIENCLNAPRGSLFVPQVSHVSRDGEAA